MKVYLTPPQPSRGLQRIADALVRYAPPGTEFTTELRDADLVILYAIGRNDALREKAHSITMRGQRYAVIQVCLRSTMKPCTYDWRDIWDAAAVVWSYYDLNLAIANDIFNYGIDVKGSFNLDNFYHAPLGADAQTFQIHKNWKARDYVILSSGLSRLSESVRECHLAAQEVGRPSAHLGNHVKLPPTADSFSGMPDDVLRGLYNTCEFVSGLRRTEGFELPAVEGLLCGARPVVFDTPDYHWNYGDHAEYIHEGTRAEVVEQLVALFKAGPRGVTEEERADAVERFNWATIIGGFYERL